MEFKIHGQENKKVAELISAECVIRNSRDGKDIMANAYHMGADSLIIEKHHLCDEFFDLSTKLAGEILQAYSNYGMKLAIIGDFSQVTSQSLKAFILESNKHGQVLFAAEKQDVLRKFGVLTELEN